MTSFARLLTAAAVAGGLAAPAAAQYPYPYPTPQPYPQTYPYGQQQSVVGTILESLLGRYQVNDRTAIRQCANAALVQAQRQYGGYGYGYNQPYGQQYGQQWGYGMRVTAITDVDRRSSGLRVEGLLDSGMSGYAQQYGYGQQYGYNQAYGDLSFRCNVDYRGYVTSVRVRPTSNWRRY